MLKLRHLGLLAALVATIVVPLSSRTRKGDGFLDKGRNAEQRKEFETALDFYEKAMQEDPADSAYMIAAKRVRFAAAMARVDVGQKLRNEGNLEAALAEFQKAYAIDPATTIAEQEIRRTKEMIQRDKNGGQASTPDTRSLTPAEKAQKESEERSSRMLPIPELKPITRQISTLKMNNQPVKVLYDTVGKLAGVNVIFDPEYQTPPGKSTFTVDLSNTTLEEALDYLAIQTKSYWKPLSQNTIFVTNDNVTKRRDYEDNVVKVFYIKNAGTVQELQEMQTTVRSVTDIRRSFVYNAQNAVLMRGTADQIALAEKLFQDLDKPKAEVVIDVIVMEANRGKVRDLAATLSPSGIKVPVFYNPGNNPNATGTSTTTGGRNSGIDTGTGTGTGTSSSTNSTGAIALNALKNLGAGDFSVNIPGALLQAFASDSQTRVIQQPQVRAVENFKASLRIGDKVPYASGSFQPGVGTVGLNPLVSTQFQFFEVGVNVDITPKVHGPKEVSMHIELEISNVSGHVELGGLSQPIISQKKVIHDIRLKEGEVNLLGGLLNTQDTRTVSGIPGLMNIPVLGKLFGPEHKEITRGELLIALVPHIVRSTEISEVNTRSISAGNDQNVKLNYQPRPEPPQAPAPNIPPTPTATTPAPVEPAPVPNASAAPRLLFSPGVLQAQLSSPVSVALVAENVQDLFTAPVKIKFDPKVLRLTSIKAGSLMTGDGQKVNFSENTMNDIGEATVTLNRMPGSSGVTGSGNLLNLSFQAVGKGTTTVVLTDASLKDAKMQPLVLPPPSVSIVVQ